MYKKVFNKQTKFADANAHIMFANLKDSDIIVLDAEGDCCNNKQFVITKQEAEIFCKESWTNGSTAHEDLRKIWDFRELDDTAVVYAVWIVRDNIIYTLHMEQAEMQEYNYAVTA